MRGALRVKESQSFVELEQRRRPRDARAKKLISAIHRAELERARATIEVGLSLGALIEEKLYANLGHPTFRSLLAELGIGRSQAYKLIALAERSSAGRIAKLGVEAAYAEAMR